MRRSSIVCHFCSECSRALLVTVVVLGEGHDGRIPVTGQLDYNGAVVL